MATKPKAFPWQSLVRLTAKFTDDAGVLIDPDEVSVWITPPDQTETSAVYGTDLAVKKDATGNYHYDVDAQDPGSWTFRWKGTGVGQAASDDTPFIIKDSLFRHDSP